MSINLTTAEHRAIRKRTKRLRVAVGVILSIMATSLLGVWATSKSPTQTLASTSTAAFTSGIEVRATLRDVDPQHGELTVRLTFTPVGTFANGGKLALPLNLVINDSSGSTLVAFDTATQMAPHDATIGLSGSSLTRYPLDRYKAELYFAFGAQTGTGLEVPVRFTLSSGLDGFAVDAHPARHSNDLALANRIAISIQRPPSVLVWCALITVIVWSLTLAAAAVAWIVIAHRRPVPFWGFGVLIGVLFALPPLRNGLPGAPPYGSLIDFAVFFWALAIVGGSIVSMVFTWHRRVRGGADINTG